MKPRRPASGAPCPRRQALAALACLVVPSALEEASCRRGPQAPAAVRIPLAELPVGGRRTVMYAGAPVDVLRTETGVVARSLLCTHFGCFVAWRAKEQLFVCACHEGRFDANGRPVAGRPRGR